MEILGAPLAVFDFVLTKVIPFVAVLTVVVFFHELGHFLVARWNRVKVDAFAVGFGPELFGWNDRQNTRWKICAIPLGGYVRFRGDADASSRPDPSGLDHLSSDEREGAFEDTALWRKALIVAAGPIANFLLALVIYTGLFASYGEFYIAPVVGKISEDSAAQEAGFRIGDTIKTIDGAEIGSFSDIARYTNVSSGEPLTFEIERDGRPMTITAAPKMTKREDQFGNTYYTGLVGIGPDPDPATAEASRRDLSLPDAFVKGADAVGMIVVRTYYFIKELILGKQDASELRGPLGIGQMTSQVATLGIVQLISLAAALSVSIGIMNLLPVPVLDGGHLVLYAVEAIRGRALSARTQEMAFRIGLGCVLVLMLFATSNDLKRLFGMTGG